MISINRYTMLAVVGAVLLSLALVQAETEEPEPKVSEGSLGTLGKKLINGARSVISHIPVIGKYTSSDKNTVGGDEPTPAAPEEPATTVTSADDEPVESSEEVASTPAGEEAPKEDAPKEDTPAEENPKEEAPKEEAPKQE